MGSLYKSCLAAKELKLRTQDILVQSIIKIQKKLNKLFDICLSLFENHENIYKSK